MTANQPSRTYAITIASQYRPGAPNGYGVSGWKGSRLTSRLCCVHSVSDGSSKPAAELIDGVQK